MSRLNCLTIDFARIGESNTRLERVEAALLQARRDLGRHSFLLRKLKGSKSKGALPRIHEDLVREQAMWVGVFSRIIVRLRAETDALRGRLNEAEPPVRTGRLTREWLRYERGCGSKPDQTRSRAARLRSIERRGVRR